MPKMKTHKGAKKRFSVTGTGKVRRLKAFKSHILTKKTSKRKRRLRQATTIKTPGEAKNIKRLIQASGRATMPRVRSNVARLKRKKQVMKAARGAFGARSKLWKAAKENVERGWKFAYRDRKNKKRDFRRLWVVRINAGAHQHGMSYSVFMHGLKKAGIEIDRKVLSDIAINDPAGFGALAEKVKSALEAA